MDKALVRLAWLAVLGSCAGASPSEERVGVIVMAHGGGPAWNAQVEEAVKPLRAGRDVEIAYGMAECATLQAAADRLQARGAERLVVVRLFVRSESFLERIRYLLGLRSSRPGAAPLRPDCCVEAPSHAECVPIKTKLPVTLTPALDGHALLGPILLERARTLSRNPKAEAVLLLSHGLGDDAANARLEEDMRRLAKAVAAGLPFRRVAVATLREDWPEKRKKAEARLKEFMTGARAEGLRVLVIPYRVAGFGPYKDVLKGWEYESDGRGFSPHPNMTRWIEERILTSG